MAPERENQDDALDVRPTDGSFAGGLMSPAGGPPPNAAHTNPFSSPPETRATPVVRMQFGLSFLFLLTFALMAPLGLLLALGLSAEETLWGLGGSVLAALLAIGVVSAAWTMGDVPTRRDF